MSFKQKCPLVFIILSMSLLLSQKVALATCDDTRCEITDKTEPHLSSTGCDQLHVKIYNNTSYTFIQDTSFTDDVSIGTVNPDSTVSSIGSSGIDFYIKGSPNGSEDLDDVDITLHYLAESNITGSPQKTGAEITFHLQKSSCNVSTTQCVKSSRNCCAWNHPKGLPKTCTWLPEQQCGCWAGSPGVPNTVDPYNCEKYWNETGYDLGKFKSSTTSSSIKTQNAVFTTAVPLTAVVSSAPLPVANTDPAFIGSQDTVCNASNAVNTAGETVFYINPALIETLTVTFPPTFNTQTPTAKLMKDSIYNNLNATYVGLLGSFFSYSPVMSEVVNNKQTFAFSTLCNSADCP